MNTEKLFLVDPYNEDHRRMIKEFENNNEIRPSILSLLNTNLTKEEYELNKKESNEISIALFLEDSSQIKDICYIQGVKDMKACTITFSPIQRKYKKRNLVPIATKFAFDTLNMQEVFISSSPNDIKLIDYLIFLGYENLGEDRGRILFLKERELETERQRIRQ